MSNQHSNPLEENDSHFKEAVNFGAEHDNVSVGNLFKWTLIVALIVLGLIFTGFELYKSYSFKTAEEQAILTTYDQLDAYKTTVQSRLNSYGIVNEQKGIYHLPIEKAIDLTIDAYSKK